MSIPVVLVVLALVFLIVNAIRSGFPLWPSVLCLILRFLVGGLVLGFLWTTDLSAAEPCRDPATNRFVKCPEVEEPVSIGEPDVVPEPPANIVAAEEPEPVEERIKVRAYAGGLTAIATDAEASVQPLASLAIEAPLSTSKKGPSLNVQADLTALPGETVEFSDPQTFKALEMSIGVSQPLGGPLLFSVYVEGGFASRLATSSEPLTRLPGWWAGGLLFRTADREHVLKIGIGGDQRLSGDWAAAVTISGAAKVGERGGVAMYLVGSLIRALDLQAYGYAQPARDSLRIGVAVGR